MSGMKLSPPESQTRIEREQVGRLATVAGSGQPHAVPVTFAWVQRRLVIGIDEKPKSTFDLKRLRNIRENSRVSLLWDKYEENWSRLWWVRADGFASIEESGVLWERSWDALNAKYPQYEGRQHEGPVILIEVETWRGWAHG